MYQEKKMAGPPGAQFQVEGNRRVILIIEIYGCYLETALHA